MATDPMHTDENEQDDALKHSKDKHKRPGTGGSPLNPASVIGPQTQIAVEPLAEPIDGGKFQQLLMVNGTKMQRSHAKMRTDLDAILGEFRHEMEDSRRPSVIAAKLERLIRALEAARRRLIRTRDYSSLKDTVVEGLKPGEIAEFIRLLSRAAEYVREFKEIPRLEDIGLDVGTPPRPKRPLPVPEPDYSDDPPYDPSIPEGRQLLPPELVDDDDEHRTAAEFGISRSQLIGDGIADPRFGDNLRRKDMYKSMNQFDDGGGGGAIHMGDAPRLPRVYPGNVATAPAEEQDMSHEEVGPGAAPSATSPRPRTAVLLGFGVPVGRTELDKVAPVNRTAAHKKHLHERQLSMPWTRRHHEAPGVPIRERELDESGIAQHIGHGLWTRLPAEVLAGYLTAPWGEDFWEWAHGPEAEIWLNSFGGQRFLNLAEQTFPRGVSVDPSEGNPSGLPAPTSMWEARSKGPPPGGWGVDASRRKADISLPGGLEVVVEPPEADDPALQDICTALYDKQWSKFRGLDLEVPDTWDIDVDSYAFEDFIEGLETAVAEHCKTYPPVGQQVLDSVLAGLWAHVFSAENLDGEDELRAHLRPMWSAAAVQDFINTYVPVKGDVALKEYLLTKIAEQVQVTFYTLTEGTYDGDPYPVMFEDSRSARYEAENSDHCTLEGYQIHQCTTSLWDYENARDSGGLPDNILNETLVEEQEGEFNPELYHNITENDIAIIEGEVSEGFGVRIPHWRNDIDIGHYQTEREAVVALLKYLYADKRQKNPEFKYLDSVAISRDNGRTWDQNDVDGLRRAPTAPEGTPVQLGLPGIGKDEPSWSYPKPGDYIFERRPDGSMFAWPFGASDVDEVEDLQAYLAGRDVHDLWEHNPATGEMSPARYSRPTGAPKQQHDDEDYQTGYNAGLHGERNESFSKDWTGGWMAGAAHRRELVQKAKADYTRGTKDTSLGAGDSIVYNETWRMMELQSGGYGQQPEQAVGWSGPVPGAWHPPTRPRQTRYKPILVEEQPQAGDADLEWGPGKLKASRVRVGSLDVMAYKQDSVKVKELRRWTDDPETTYAIISPRENVSETREEMSISESRQWFSELRQIVEAAGYEVRAVRGKWTETEDGIEFDRTEPSAFILGIDFDSAVALGKRYGQQAIIFKDETGVVGMYWLNSGTANIPAREGQPLFGAEAVKTAPSLPKEKRRGPPAKQDLYTHSRSMSFEYVYDWSDPRAVVPWAGGPVTRGVVESRYADQAAEEAQEAAGESAVADEDGAAGGSESGGNRHSAGCSGSRPGGGRARAGDAPKNVPQRTTRARPKLALDKDAVGVIDTTDSENDFTDALYVGRRDKAISKAPQMGMGNQARVSR